MKYIGNSFFIAFLFAPSLMAMNFTIESLVGFDITLRSLDSMLQSFPVLLNDVKKEHQKLIQEKIDISEDLKKLTHDVAQKDDLLKQKDAEIKNLLQQLKKEQLHHQLKDDVEPFIKNALIHSVYPHHSALFAMPYIDKVPDYVVNDLAHECDFMVILAWHEVVKKEQRCPHNVFASNSHITSLISKNMGNKFAILPIVADHVNEKTLSTYFMEQLKDLSPRDAIEEIVFRCHGKRHDFMGTSACPQQVWFLFSKYYQNKMKELE